MAATDLNDLNNFEEHFESAAVTFLNSDVGITVTRTVVEDDLVAPRIEVQFFVEQANEPPAMRNGGGSSSTIDYRSFAGTFSARLITDNATGGAGDHATYRSKMRTALMRSGSNWGSTNLPYYGVKLLRPSATDYDVDGDMNISTLSYELVWEIRDDAWPA
tara:strand:+ start:9447 stop:9929 length:483 start_codon:yes stop_codon:yes gene_type:complete